MTKNFAPLVEIIAAQAGEAPPEWFRLLPLGQVEMLNREPFTVDRETLEGLVAVFKERGLDLVIDYEHQTLTGDRAPAAGWIKSLEARLDGLWARVEWTKQAQDYLKNREYRYFSPVLEMDAETRKPLKLYHVGLTNFPAINNLPALVAKMGEGDEAQAAQAAQAKAEDMKIHEEARAMKNKIVGLLALKAEAPEEEILAALKTRLALAAALPEIGGLLGLKAEEITISSIKGAVMAMKQSHDQVQTLQQEVAALKAEGVKAKAEAAVAEAIKARKITPALKDWALAQAEADLEAFKTYVDKAPVMIPDAAPLKFKSGDGKGEVALTEGEAIICKSLGVSAEDFKAEQKRLAEQAG